MRLILPSLIGLKKAKQAIGPGCPFLSVSPRAAKQGRSHLRTRVPKLHSLPRTNKSISLLGISRNRPAKQVQNCILVAQACVRRFKANMYRPLFEQARRLKDSPTRVGKLPTPSTCALPDCVQRFSRLNTANSASMSNSRWSWINAPNVIRNFSPFATVIALWGPCFIASRPKGFATKTP